MAFGHCNLRSWQLAAGTLCCRHFDSAEVYKSETKNNEETRVDGGGVSAGPEAEHIQKTSPENQDSLFFRAFTDRRDIWLEAAQWLMEKSGHVDWCPMNIQLRWT